MTHEEIIKAWFAIEEMGGENVHTELKSYPNWTVKINKKLSKKMYRAYISFGIGYEFSAYETDVYLAMENAINKYSEFITKSEIK